MKKKRKNSSKSKNLVILVLILGIIAFLVFGISKLFKKNQIMYIASNTNEAILYNEEEKKVDTIYRGTEVSKTKQVTKNKTKYYEIKYKKRIFYVPINNLVENKKNVVLEKAMYVRTPCHILKSEKNYNIITLANKSEKLTIIGYNNIDSKGNVHMYKVTKDQKEGYVYGKYLAASETEAQKNYNAEKLDPIFSKVNNPYGGGEAINLDYYPEEKPTFKDNPMPESVYALYINNWKSTIKNIDSYIALAKETKINTLVVDIKENSSIGYPSEVMKKITKTSYQNANNTYEEYKEAITKIKNAGLYVVGRIVVFKDDFYIKDHPEEAISTVSDNTPYYHQKAYWPTAYSRNVWYYNVALSVEAVKEFGFNEINYDYVRFPDGITKAVQNNVITLKNNYNEEKTQAIQRFLQYAKDVLHEYNAYLSVDVFGESNGTFTTSYGQYWPAISNIVDVISGMPYPDHFASGNYNLQEPWNHPYELMNAWAKQVTKRQAETPNPAKVRTWVQAYNAQKTNGIEYNASEIKAQVTGLFDAGIKDGYITWHSGSNVEKYTKQKSAFAIDYLQGGY